MFALQGSVLVRDGRTEGEDGLRQDRHRQATERSASTVPPRPVPAFRIGVTGARDLETRPAELRGEIRRQIREVLEAVRDRVASVAREPAARAVYAASEPRLRLLSPLAEGADRLAAEVALDLGYELDVALPFARADYAGDFADAVSRAAFDRFLCPEATPGLVACFALDGGRGDDETRSYEAVGRLVVRNCDLLIAVWDGRPARGRGGTADIVRFSARFGPPVWWIDPAGNAPARLIRTTADLRKPDHAPRAAEATAHLADLIGTLLRPPPARRHRQGLAGRAIDALQGRRSAEAGEGDPFRDYLNAPLPAVHPLLRLLSRGTLAAGGSPSAPALTVTPAPNDPTTYWNAAFRQANWAANTHDDRRRTFSLQIYALAALAAASAVAALAFESIKPAATAIEILLLLAMLGLVAANEGSNRHGHQTACRLLAEICRMQGALAALAWSLPPPIPSRSLDAAAPDHGPQAEAWVGWYFGALLRAAPLPTGDLHGARLVEIRDHLRTAIIEPLLRDQRDRQARRRRAAHRLGRAGTYAILATLAVVIADLTLIGTSAGTHTAAVILLGCLSAVMPAVAAALIGLRASIEPELREERATRLIDALEAAGARIDALDLRQPLASQDLAVEIVEASYAVLQDLDGWPDLFEVKHVEAG